MSEFARPPSLSTLVTDHIRNMIVSGELPLGAAISERGISTQLNVSKTPVREALSQLRHEGLVSIVPQSGARVFTLSAREVADICTFRRYIEAAALELAMAHDCAGLLAELRRIEGQMQVSFGSGEVRNYLDLDTAFHLAFFEHCGNSYLQNAYHQYSGKIAALRTHLAQKPDHTRLSLKEHGEIVDAVQRGDVVALKTVLEAHIGRTRETYEVGVEDISLD